MNNNLKYVIGAVAGILLTFGGFKIFSNKECPEVVKTVIVNDTVFIPFPAVVRPEPDRTITQVIPKSKPSRPQHTHKETMNTSNHDEGQVPSDWSTWFEMTKDTSFDWWSYEPETHLMNIYYDTLTTKEATVYSEIWTNGTLEFFKPTISYNNRPNILTIEQVRKDMGIFPAATVAIGPTRPEFLAGGFLRYKALFTGYQYNITNKSHNITIGGAIEF